MTRIDEVARDIFRISTPVSPSAIPGGFSFNQYLIVDDAPLLFHTGSRAMFDDVRRAIARITPVESLRYIAVSHFEADECGSLNAFLAIARHSIPICSRVAALVSLNDFSDRPPMALADGEILDLGAHRLAWYDTPHTPHAWECGLGLETETKTLFCGDIFTQGGADGPALTDRDILEASEAFRDRTGYFAVTEQAKPALERLAETCPATLACMHGSAWQGNGAKLLRALAARLDL